MTDIYVSALGQLDNIGDSALRRGYLNALRLAGTLHVLVPDDEPYVSGLGLPAEDIRYRLRDRWRVAALRGAIRGHAGFALNAGEATLDSDYAKYCGRIAAIAALARFRGTKVVIAGSGFRPGFLGDPLAGSTLVGDAPWAVRTLARRCAFVGWRDEQTQRAVDIGTVVPDWAFGLGQSSDSLLQPERAAGRDLLVISLRASGPSLTRERTAQVRRLATKGGLDPVVLVQVGRDNELAEKVAKESGFRCLPWHGGSHLEREAFVRSIYARSRWVISNRVHALILALTEGAIPLAPADLGSEKSARIFHAAGISNVSVPASTPLSELPAAVVAAGCFAELCRARASLELAAGRLVDVLPAVRQSGRVPAAGNLVTQHDLPADGLQP
ncbi:MAG: polysaccharide pyruvyl transferase family protein [Nakamurella sp.]